MKAWRRPIGEERSPLLLAGEQSPPLMATVTQRRPPAASCELDVAEAATSETDLTIEGALIMADVRGRHHRRVAFATCVTCTLGGMAGGVAPFCSRPSRPS